MSILASTRNTRPILPDSLRFIRSDAPFSLTENELKWLRDNNVTMAVDLRAPDEAKACPSVLAAAEGFTYLNIPVTGGNIVPKTPDDVGKSYIAMADEQMNRIIEAIMSAETNVIFFCSAGKDRTGVVSALLLKKLGFDDEYIIADYLRSGEELRELLEAYAKSGVADIDVITPQRRYIAEFLDFTKRASHD